MKLAKSTRNTPDVASKPTKLEQTNNSMFTAKQFHKVRMGHEPQTLEGKKDHATSRPKGNEHGCCYKTLALAIVMNLKRLLYTNQLSRL